MKAMPEFYLVAIISSLILAMAIGWLYAYNVGHENTELRAKLASHEQFVRKAVEQSGIEVNSDRMQYVGLLKSPAKVIMTFPTGDTNMINVTASTSGSMFWHHKIVNCKWHFVYEQCLPTISEGWKTVIVEMKTPDSYEVTVKERYDGPMGQTGLMQIYADGIPTGGIWAFQVDEVLELHLELTTA